jgi:MFS family permease
MKFFAKNGSDKKDNSLSLFHAEAAAANAESAGCNLQSNSLIATGASDSTVLILSTVTNMVLAALLIKVPSLVEGKTPMKKTVVTMAFVNALTWIPIVFTFLFFHQINPVMLIALWIFGLVPATLIGPLRDNWLANMVPPEKMGRYLSFRSVIAGIFYLLAFNIMGFTLLQTKGDVYKGFAIVLGIAFTASLVSTFIYSTIHAPAPAAKSETTNKPSLSFTNFLKGARKEHLGTFILFSALFNFAVSLSGPLLAVHMMKDLHFSAMTYTMVVSFEFVARVISITFWGKMVDKSGSLRVLGIASHLIPFGPLLWIFSGNVVYLCAVQLFSGTVWAAYDLACQTFIYKSTQPEQRLHYIVYCKSLTTFSGALGTLCSAFLLGSMFKIGGSQILGMLVLSAALRMTVVRLMLPKLKPGGIPDAIVHEELARELAMVNYPTRQGLYYHPEAWSRFSKPVSAFGTMIGKAVNKIAPKPAGLYYNPQKWSNYMGQNADLQPVMVQATQENKKGLYHNTQAWNEYMQQTAVLIEHEEEPVKEGLLYNREAWETMMNQTAQANARIVEPVKPSRKALLHDTAALAALASQAAQAEARKLETARPVRKGLLNDSEAMAKFMKQTTAAEAKAIDGAKAERSGLFYDADKWGNYLKQSAGLAATTMRFGGDTQTNRQPIYYHPEAWNNYKSQTAVTKTAINPSTVGVRTAGLYHPEGWDGTFDPEMVHIGRKYTTGTTVTKRNPAQNMQKKVTATAHPVVRTSASTAKRFGTRPSLA